MSSLVKDPQMWTSRRLWTTAVLAIGVQVGLIHWASDRTPFQPRSAIAQPGVLLAANVQGELLALTDPTIFARAHPNGYSASAWLAIPAQQYSGDETNDAPRWLALEPAQLGAHFRDFIRSNPPAAFVSGGQPQSVLTKPGTVPALQVAATSTVRVAGALARRALLHVTPPPAQTNSDILKPSEVQLRIDARGNPVSVVLLKSSGLKLADQLAVALARDAQFAPDRAALTRSLSDPEAGMVSGQMIFNWHTVPAPLPGGTAPAPNPR